MVQSLFRPVIPTDSLLCVRRISSCYIGVEDNGRVAPGRDKVRRLPVRTFHCFRKTGKSRKGDNADRQ